MAKNNPLGGRPRKDNAEALDLQRIIKDAATPYIPVKQRTTQWQTARLEHETYRALKQLQSKLFDVTGRKHSVSDVVLQAMLAGAPKMLKDGAEKRQAELLRGGR
jgi:hypothetical protein